MLICYMMLAHGIIHLEQVYCFLIIGKTKCTECWLNAMCHNNLLLTKKQFKTKLIFSVHWKTWTFSSWILSSLFDDHSLLSELSDKWLWLCFIGFFFWKRADNIREADIYLCVSVCVCVWQWRKTLYLDAPLSVGYRLKPSWRARRWRRRWWWRSAQSQWMAGPSTQLPNT